MFKKYRNDNNIFFIELHDFQFNNDRYLNTYFMQLIRAYYNNTKYIIRLFYIESLTFNLISGILIQNWQNYSMVVYP